MRCQGGEEVDPPLVPRLECVTECTVEQTRKVFDQGTIFSVKMCGGLKYNVGICSFKPTMEGLKRMLAKPTVRKEPVTANMLKAMVEATGPEPHLSKVRLLAVCLEAFAGFLHCNELIKLKCSDITFNAEDMVINVQSRGAIAAANAGVQDTLFKRHGCWKSESAKDGYGKDSAQRWFFFCTDLFLSIHAVACEKPQMQIHGSTIMESDFLPISLSASIVSWHIIRSYVAFQLAISVSHKYWLGGGQPMACRTNPTPGIRVHWSGACGPHLHRLPYPVDTTHPLSLPATRMSAGHGMVTKRIKSSIWTQLATTTFHKSSAGSGIYKPSN
eukprot:Em0004g847a